VIIDRYNELIQAFSHYPSRVHYALKANSTLAIARCIRSLGGGVDVNSGGELDVALRAGFTPSDIVFTGVGKSEAELDRAISLGVHTINAESHGELTRIDRLAQARSTRARVALRVNPDISAGDHPNISTGQRSHKFGVPLESAREICLQASSLDGLHLVGLHVHVGSQILKIDPICRAAEAIVKLVSELSDAGIIFEHLDLGGGLGISYDGSDVIGVSDYSRALIDLIKPTGLSVLLEPGRWIIGPAGFLISTVVDVKYQAPSRYFVVLDSGMSELMRPALYNSFHRVLPLESRITDPVTCDIVGPICETSDVIARGRTMPLPEVGDRLVVLDTGAYGIAMASNYNRHPIPAEVMIEDGGWQLIRKRQTYDDLVALEI
jgi:diaminopimelate decarboxylase